MKCVFDKETCCAALREKNCHDECSFRKTQKQLAEGRKKADERIASLPAEQQAHIRFKYKQLCRSVCVCREEGE